MGITAVFFTAISSYYLLRELYIEPPHNCQYKIRYRQAGEDEQ